MTTTTRTHTSTLFDRPEYENNPGWITRHCEAIRHPIKAEVPILGLIKAWLAYADAYPATTQYRIGEDVYAGPEWARIGHSLIQLLSTDRGPRLDGGTLDHVIRQAWIAEGFSEEGD